MHISNITISTFFENILLLPKLTPLRNGQSAQLTFVVPLVRIILPIILPHVFVEFRFVYCTMCIRIVYYFRVFFVVTIFSCMYVFSDNLFVYVRVLIFPIFKISCMYRYTRNTIHETRRFRVSTSQLYQLSLQSLADAPPMPVVPQYDIVELY